MKHREQLNSFNPELLEAFYFMILDKPVRLKNGVVDKEEEVFIMSIKESEMVEVMQRNQTRHVVYVSDLI